MYTIPQYIFCAPPGVYPLWNTELEHEQNIKREGWSGQQITQAKGDVLLHPQKGRWNWTAC